MTQAIADVERMEQEEQANRKAMLEAKALLGTKVEEIRGAAEDVKTLMEMPVLVENSVPEPHAVAQVIEVPAQGPSAGNLDIIIVDSGTLGGQEELPPDAECQVVEVVLDPKNSDGSKQDAASSEAVTSLDPQETLSSSGEQDIPLNDQKAAVEKEQQDSVKENTEGEPLVGRSSDGTVMGGTETGEDASVRELGMDEGSRIALVAIEIPTSKAEEKEMCKTDKNEELSKQMEQNIKKNEDEVMMKEEIKQETTSVETTKHDKAVNIEEQKEQYDGTNELQASEGQGIERNETTKEVVVSDVKRVAAGESVEDKAEETVEAEKDASGETGDEQCVLKEEDMPAAEHIQESVKRSEEEAEKRDTEVEDFVTEKISEATEEEDSHAESSEDEKKTDEKADRAEEENARLMAFCFLVYSVVFCELRNLFVTEKYRVFRLQLLFCLFVIKPTDAPISQIYFVMKLFVYRTVHVSIIRSLFTVHLAMVYVKQLSIRTRMFHPGPARKLCTDLYDIYYC